MDTFTIVTLACNVAFIYMGEKFTAGVYLWLGMLFAVLLALRQAETAFYIITAGEIAVLAYRTFSKGEDVRNTTPGDSN